MKQHSSGVVIGTVLALIVGFGVVAGIWLGLRSTTSLGYDPSTYYASKNNSGTFELDLQVFPDSQVCHAGASAPQINWVSYCPSTSLEVPPNSTITVVIKQYDSSSTLHNDYYRQVQGTLDGQVDVNGTKYSQLDATKVAHTFTLQSPPDSLYPLFVSVPLMGTPTNAPTNAKVNGIAYPTPNIITFQFQTGPAGTYVWHCYDPCGSGLQGDNPATSNANFGGPMSTTGFMAGTLTVANY